MNSIKINDIEVRYDDSISEDYLNGVKDTLNKNYKYLTPPFVISFIPTSDEAAIYVDESDFILFLSLRIVDYLEKNRQLLSQEYVEDACLEFFIRAYNSIYLARDIRITTEYLLMLFLLKFFESKGEENVKEKIEEFLKKNKVDLSEIISFIESCCDKLRLYNKTLERLLLSLKMNDFPNNIAEIAYMKYEETYRLLMGLGSASVISADAVETIDTDLDNLFYEFLRWINAPPNWYELYDEMKKSGKIETLIIAKQQVGDSENESRSYFVPAGDDSAIRAVSVNFFGVFLKLVHEFVHFISFRGATPQNTINLSLLEFPSVFFEKLAKIFLTNKYPSSLLDKNSQYFRELSNLNNYMTDFNLVCDLAFFSKRGRLDEKEELYSREYEKDVNEEMSNGILEKFGVTIQTYKNGILVEESSGDSLSTYYDDYVIRVNGGVRCNIEIYSYIFATYLSDILLSRLDNDSSIIERMIRITEGLPNLTLQDIMDEFGLHECLEQHSYLHQKNRA